MGLPSRGWSESERGMGTSQTRSSIQRRKLRDIICDNGRSKVTRTQRIVMRMVSGENPRIPCQAEKTDLDFDGIVRDIVAQQEAIKNPSHGLTPDLVLDKLTFETLFLIYS